MFSNVLVGVDGRAGGHDAIALARQLAAADASVALAHIHGGDLRFRTGAALALAGGRKDSDALLARERADASLDAVSIAHAARSVGHGLHELAARRSADLLVIGSCRRGSLGQVALGDDTLATLNGARCAVAIAPTGYADRPPGFENVGVGYDGSPESHRALAAARALAACHGSKIRTLSVASLQSIPYGEPIPIGWTQLAKGLVDDELQRLHDIGEINGDATYDDPGEALARFGDDVDLLIVGSRANGPVERLISGSTSNYLANHVRCPLLVLPRTATGPSANELTAVDMTTKALR